MEIETVIPGNDPLVKPKPNVNGLENYPIDSSREALPIHTAKMPSICNPITRMRKVNNNSRSIILSIFSVYNSPETLAKQNVMYSFLNL